MAETVAVETRAAMRASDTSKESASDPKVSSDVVGALEVRIKACEDLKTSHGDLKATLESRLSSVEAETKSTMQSLEARTKACESTICGKNK